MDKQTISETVIALEKKAMEAWLSGDSTPFLDLYSKDFTYFDPAQPKRLDGWEKIKELYENMQGKMKTDRFEMLNPVVQTTGTTAVLTYNLSVYSGPKVWRENCTEVYRLEADRTWRIIHSHISPTKPFDD